MTLEPGDVILTGTPAGSSVVLPGDVVEVEVDAPNAPGAPTTGRLVTTVTQGTTAFGPDVREHAEGRRSTARSKPGAAKQNTPRQSPPAVWRRSTVVQPPPAAPLTDEIRELLDGVAVATVSAALRKRGYLTSSSTGSTPNHEGDRSLAPPRLSASFRSALTCSSRTAGGFNAQKRAFDTVNPGEVLVVEARGIRSTGTVGDVLALRAQAARRRGQSSPTAGCAISRSPGVRHPRLLRTARIPAVLGRTHVPWESRRHHRLRRRRSTARRHHHGRPRWRSRDPPGRSRRGRRRGRRTRRSQTNGSRIGSPKVTPWTDCSR